MPMVYRPSMTNATQQLTNQLMTSQAGIIVGELYSVHSLSGESIIKTVHSYYGEAPNLSLQPSILDVLPTPVI